MTHYDTVISSRPTAYFPLQQDTVNHGTTGTSAGGLWTPQAIETSAWYDASGDGVILTSDRTVSFWFARDDAPFALKSSSLNAPVVEYRSCGGLDTVKFASTPMKINKTSWSDNIGIFAVTRKASLPTTTGGFILDASTSSSFASSRGFRFDSYNTYQRLGVSTDGTGSFAQVTQQYNDEFIVKSAWYDGSTIGMQNHNNGTIYTASTESGPISYTGVTETTLGGYLSTSSSYSFYGNIAELLVTPYAPTVQERDAINHYLATKWGLPQNPSSQYANAEPPVSLQYEDFRLSDSSRYSLNLAGGGLSLQSIIPSISKKLWRRGMTFECLFYPNGDATLFETVDQYNVVEDEVAQDRVIRIKVVGGSNIVVTVGNTEIESLAFSRSGVKHVSVTIANQEVLISVDGTLIGSGTYADFDLYGHELKDIEVYGTGHISDIALYVGGGGSGWSATGNDLALVSGPESLVYDFSSTSIDYTTVTQSPLGGRWPLADSINIENENYLSPLNPVTIKYSGQKQNLSVLELSSELVLDGLEKLIINPEPTSSLYIGFEFSEYETDDKRVVLLMESDNSVFMAYIDGDSLYVSHETNNELVESLVASVASDTRYLLQLEFTSDAVLANVFDYNTSTTLGTATVDDNVISSTISRVVISPNELPLVGTLTGIFCARYFSPYTYVTWYSDLYRLRGMPQGYTKMYVGDADAVFWSPDAPNIYSPTVSGVPGVTQGGDPVIETPLISFTSLGLPISIYLLTSIKYNDRSVAPVNGKDSLEITGGFSPAIEDGPLWRQNHIESFYLNAGYLELSPDKSTINYVPDFSFSDVTKWTPSNCIISLESNPLLSNGYGIVAEYTSQAPKVTSETIYVLSSTEYAAAVNLRVVPGPTTVSLNIDWYDASNQFLSTTTTSQSVMTVPETLYVSGTSPATAKYCKVSVSAPSSTGSMLLDSVFFGRSFSGDYNNFYSGFNVFSALVKPTGDFYVLAHQYRYDYYIRINNGIITFNGFDEVRVNDTAVNYADDISNYTGLTHIQARQDNGIMRPGAEQPAYIGRSYDGSVASGTAEIALVKFSNTLDENEYRYVCGSPEVVDIVDETSATITLNDDPVLAISSAWTIIQ